MSNWNNSATADAADAADAAGTDKDTAKPLLESALPYNLQCPLDTEQPAVLLGSCYRGACEIRN